MPVPSRWLNDTTLVAYNELSERLRSSPFPGSDPHLHSYRACPCVISLLFCVSPLSLTADVAIIHVKPSLPLSFIIVFSYSSHILIARLLISHDLSRSEHIRSIIIILQRGQKVVWPGLIYRRFILYQRVDPSSY